MLKNAESNAEVKGLDVDALVIDHIQVSDESEKMEMCKVYMKTEFRYAFSAIMSASNTKTIELTRMN